VRGEFELLKNANNVVAAKWMDTKDVNVMSNCHKGDSVIMFYSIPPVILYVIVFCVVFWGFSTK